MLDANLQGRILSRSCIAKGDATFGVTPAAAEGDLSLHGHEKSLLYKTYCIVYYHPKIARRSLRR